MCVSSPCRPRRSRQRRREAAALVTCPAEGDSLGGVNDLPAGHDSLPLGVRATHIHSLMISDSIGLLKTSGVICERGGSSTGFTVKREKWQIILGGGQCQQHVLLQKMHLTVRTSSFEPIYSTCDVWTCLKEHFKLLYMNDARHKTNKTILWHNNVETPKNVTYPNMQLNTL